MARVEDTLNYIINQLSLVVDVLKALSEDNSSNITEVGEPRVVYFDDEDRSEGGESIQDKVCEIEGEIEPTFYKEAQEIKVEIGKPNVPSLESLPINDLSLPYEPYQLESTKEEACAVEEEIVPNVEEDIQVMEIGPKKF